MGKKQQEREERMRASKRKQQTKIIITTVVIVAILGGILYFANYSSNKNAPNGIDATLNETGDLVIAKTQIAANQLNKVEYDGPEELLVYVDENGAYKTALDTCQECFDAGHVTYTLRDDALICSNCQQSVPLETLGEESWGGCQPLSIPETYRTDTDDSIVVPKALLTYINGMLFQWEAGNQEITLADYEI